MRALLFALLLAFICLQCCSGEYTANCVFQPAGDADVSGTVTLTQASPGGVVTLSGTITNIPDGPHALHVHTYGDVTSATGSAAGGHWNPGSASHGCYPSPTRHAGDIGNITFTGGSYTFPGGFTRDLLELSSTNSIVGRSLILHELADDCMGASGNAGSRLAQCTIGLAKPTTTQDAVYGGAEAEWAVAKMHSLSSAAVTVSGNVWFHKPSGGNVRVYARLTTSDANSVQRGMHVHEYGDLTNLADGGNTGGHYNPLSNEHDLPGVTLRHQGDMGNFWSDPSGNIIMNKEPGLLDMGASLTNIIGRGVVLHSLVDDGGQPTGNAGPKLAIGAIGIAGAQPIARAVAVIKGTSNAPGVAGTVYIQQVLGSATTVTISGTITGLTPGTHGFHIHEFGDTSNTDGTSAGGHYNPNGQPHACYPTAARHVGDITNIVADSSGTYTFPSDFTRDLVTLTGSNSVIGRAFVIHAAADDCTGASGNAGARHAIGIIGLENVATPMINPGYSGSGATQAYVEVTSIESPATAATGKLFLDELTGSVRIRGTVTGLAADSVHGMHIHEFGDMSSATGGNLGGHYNPGSVAHGYPTSATHHFGDLGNVRVNPDGVAYIDVTIQGITLSGFDSAIGRALVFHSGRDDGGQPTGNAGSKVLAGVIGVRNTGTVVPSIQTSEMTATCVFKSAGDPDVSGTVTLSQSMAGGPVTLAGSINNIPDGVHALHVHTYGDMTSSGSAAGGHWNPTGVAHACYPSSSRHAGDIGNITFSGGSYTFPGGFTRDLIELTGPNSVIGRSLILHAAADDCMGASGNAGARLGQCTIGLSSPAATFQAAYFDGSAFPATWAVAKLQTLTGASVTTSGSVWFRAMENGAVRVFARTESTTATERTHAIHVHAYGDLSDAAGADVGGHYNPANVAHALPPTTPRHVGDMGNWATDASGAISFSKDLDLLTLGASNAISNIIGRAVVMHAGSDDGGQPTGNAGSKVAAGPIGISVSPPAKAVVVMKGTLNSPNVAGTLYLEQPMGPGSAVTISGSLTGLTPGDHAIHIHAFGDPSSPDGTSAGGHFNPDNADHGCYPATPRHAGDIGTITAGSDGSYTFPADFTRDLIDLSGSRSVIGRGMVIHALADDCMGSSGNAGARHAVGVIGVANTPSTDMNVASNGADAADVTTALAVMQSITDPAEPSLEGTIYLTQVGGSVRIRGSVSGLAVGEHGMHVHAYGDLSSATGGALGGHYNPLQMPHGLPPSSMRHYGDLGNVTVASNGVAVFDKTIAGVSLTGFDSILGRALVFHNGPDLGTGSSGDAGPKVAAGVIGICDGCPTSSTTSGSTSAGQGSSSSNSDESAGIAGGVVGAILLCCCCCACVLFGCSKLRDGDDENGDLPLFSYIKHKMGFGGPSMKKPDVELEAGGAIDVVGDKAGDDALL